MTETAAAGFHAERVGGTETRAHTDWLARADGGYDRRESAGDGCEWYIVRCGHCEWTGEYGPYVPQPEDHPHAGRRIALSAARAWHTWCPGVVMPS